MQGRELYEYALLRLVPRAEREEFFNIGVILYCRRSRYLGVKLQIDESLAQAMCKDIDLQAIRAHIRALQLIANGEKGGGVIAALDIADRFRWLTAARSTLLQCSKVHAGMTNDAAAALEDIFARHVCR